MDEVVIYDLNKRNELISKIMDLINKEEMSQVDCYGILEHCKNLVFSDSLFNTLQEFQDEHIDKEDESNEK